MPLGFFSSIFSLPSSLNFFIQLQVQWAISLQASSFYPTPAVCVAVVLSGAQGREGEGSPLSHGLTSSPWTVVLILEDCTQLKRVVEKIAGGT